MLKLKRSPNLESLDMGESCGSFFPKKVKNLVRSNPTTKLRTFWPLLLNLEASSKFNLH